MPRFYFHAPGASMPTRRPTLSRHCALLLINIISKMTRQDKLRAARVKHRCGGPAPPTPISDDLIRPCADAPAPPLWQSEWRAGDDAVAIFGQKRHRPRRRRHLSLSIDRRDALAATRFSSDAIKTQMSLPAARHEMPTSRPPRHITPGLFIGVKMIRGRRRWHWPAPKRVDFYILEPCHDARRHQ